ncbi:MAG: hypothetical protein JSV33_00705 [bacterium]|nr:MAG: hypothetical protein JSV33_00705 [bacterium]
MSVLLLVILLEAALHVYHTIRRRPPLEGHPGEESLYVILDTPVLYGLNPNHPEINSQGLRDDEVTVPKPAGCLRILILGDSITFGTLIGKEKAYPSKLERLLRAQSRSVDVINAGVSGYTAYNELQYYLVEGRKYEPDIVIVAFCMNDVANPRIHWGSNISRMIDIPQEAIPNKMHDEGYALPFVEWRSSIWYRLMMRSELYRTFGWRIRLLVQEFKKAHLPTIITANDTTSIKVLLSETSTEFRWLLSNYRQLNDAVHSDGASMLVLLFPLAYQLDDHYPFFPQQLISKCCTEYGIPCLDLLETFRQYGKEYVFLLDRTGYNDVWHLSGRGHGVVALRLREWVNEYIASEGGI